VTSQTTKKEVDSNFGEDAQRNNKVDQFKDLCESETSHGRVLGLVMTTIKETSLSKIDLLSASTIRNRWISLK